MNIPLNKNTDTSPIRYRDNCDKYDYIIAVACGTVAGLIDVFLVGSPGNSVLGTWTDAQADNCVKAFAKLNGWSPRAGKENSMASAIGHLERAFKVNYDHSNSGATLGAVSNMSPKNHHMKSLAHSPSPIGLFFSILNQFTSTSTFLSNGQLITINTETYDLVGGNFVSKLFCGIANWIGHIMSDVAGSSGGRGNSGRGSGIVMPFYELFGLCNFGSFNVDRNRKTLAQLATRAFEDGYDLRFGAAMAIPVILCELSIRLIWSLRRYFQYKKPIKECIPTMQHDDLRVMLLCGHGSLCLIDGVDAVIRSGGNPLSAFMRINLIGWYRLVCLALKEVCIRTGISLGMQSQIEAFKRVGAAVEAYLAKLERIDIDAFKRETAQWKEVTAIINDNDNEFKLNKKLKTVMKKMGIDIPWESTHDSFGSFMQDKNAILTFD